MKNKTWNKMKESTSLKIIGLIALGVIAVGIIFGVYATEYIPLFRKSDEVAARDKNSYYQTESCANTMKAEALKVGSTAYEIFYGYDADNEDLGQWLDQSFGPDISNSQFELQKKKNSGDGYYHVRGNIQDDVTYGVEQTWTIAAEFNDALYIADVDDTSANALFRVTIAVKDPVTYEDAYYSGYWNYNKYGSLANWVIPASLMVMVGVSVLIIIYECFACGHVKGKEGIADIWMDRIPYEVMTIVFILAGMLWFSMFFESGGLQVTFSLAVVPVYLLGIVWLLSTIRRIKKGHFGDHTFTLKLIRGFREVPAIWDIWIIALAAVFLIITVVLGFSSSNIPLIVCLVIIDAALLYLSVSIVWSMYVILQASKEMAGGNLDYQLSSQQLSRLYGPFHEYGENLNSIGNGMKIAVEEKMKSERLKTELITNVSHDLRTPLTSIISYVDLLGKEHTAEQEKEYLDGLARQSGRLNRLCTDLVDASKASTGNIPVNLTRVSIQELIQQSLAEYAERFERRKLQIITEVKPEELAGEADGRLLWRVLSNLFSNVSKYTMEGTRVYVSAADNGDQTMTLSIKNISREKLNISAEELMERFVRGDRSRHTEGSGLGLDIARSLVELMNGTFHIMISGDLFTAEIILPVYHQEEEEKN